VVEPGGALREVPGSGDPGLDEDWARLARVRPGNVDDLAVVRRVWSRSVPAATGWDRVPPLRAPRPPAPPRATAAHPRAYRGTTHQPPKPARPTLDLQPIERWSTLRGLLDLDAAEPHPFAAARWGKGAGIDLDGLHPALREALPILGDLAPAAVDALDHRVRRLRLPERFCFAAADHPSALAPWLDALLCLDAAHQGSLAEALAAGCPPADSATPGAIVRVAVLGEGFSERIARFVDAAHRGADAAFLAGALELEAESGPGAFEAPLLGRRALPLGRRDVLPLVRALAERLVDHEAVSLPSLHAALGVSPDWAELVEDLARRPDVTPAELAAWLAVAPGLPYQSLAALGITRQALERRARIPLAARPGFARRVAEGIWLRSGDAKPAVARRLLSLAERTAAHANEVMHLLFVQHLAGRDLPTPEGLLRALEKRLSRRSRTALAIDGVAALLDGAPELARALIDEAPQRFVRLAITIGPAHPARTTPAVRGARREALWDPPADLDRLRRVLPELLAVAPASVPRVLRLAVRDGTPLSPTRAAGHLAGIRAGWSLVRAALVERAVARELQRGVTPEPRTLSREETLALGRLGRSGRQRRALRRVLRAILDGRDPELFAHPASRRWFAGRPELDEAKWRQGLELVEEVAGFGAVRIGTESDLLEVLRLGDHTGTCFALGGMFEEDPAAVALDVNKQVVFARCQGRVLARQIVAVSEAGELVGYPVYFVDAEHPGLVEAFVRFDHALAERLGLAIATEEAPEVALVLAQDLWFDDAWDRLRPE